MGEILRLRFIGLRGYENTRQERSRFILLGNYFYCFGEITATIQTIKSFRWLPFLGYLLCKKAVIIRWNSFVKITAHLLLCFFFVMIIRTTKNFPLFIFISIAFDSFDDSQSF